MSFLKEESISRKMFRYLALILYYTFARYLPNLPHYNLGKISRSFLCKIIFQKCGKNINVEYMAYFGLGTNLER